MSGRDRTTQPKRKGRPRHGAQADDSAIRSLSDEERARLSIDSWEPSLLRHLLRAEDGMPGKSPVGRGRSDESSR